MSAQFNPPPGWPVPSGWTPPQGWEPDPTWPAAPAGWQFWAEDAPEPLTETVPPELYRPAGWAAADDPAELAYGAEPDAGVGFEDQRASGSNNRIIVASVAGLVVAALVLVGVVIIVFTHRHNTAAAGKPSTAHQSGAAAPAPSSSPPSPSTTPPPPAPVLDGAYRVDLNFAQRMIDGVLDPAPDRSAWWAYRSVCKPAGCVATATKLDANLNQDTGGAASTDVFRFVTDHWEDPPTPYPGQVSCPGGGSAAVTMLGHSSWYPQPDGTFQGVQVADVQTPTCGVQGEAFRVPFTAARIGDVPPGVTVADPALAGS